MITNDKQYKTTKLQIDNFKSSLEAVSIATLANGNTHPKIIEAQKSAIESQLNELIAEIKEYEDLKAGRILVTEINDLSELPLALIKSRIANGLTQADFAEKLGMKMQQVQRYESEKYASTSLKSLIRVAETLGLKLKADILLTDLSEAVQFDVKKYPFKQMYNRGWFGNFTGTLNEAVLQAPELLSGLFKSAGFEPGKIAFTKKTVRTDGKFNEYALDAWYARVLQRAREQNIEVKFTAETISEQWLRNLSNLSTLVDGPLQAAEYLKRSGIRFIVEQPLEETYLDGAAMLMEKECPIIAITLRHDRLDNFWYVLFHELAHIHLHLNETINVIFDDLDVVEEGIEKEADDYALNAMIPSEVWRKSLVRFNATEKGILNLAASLNVNPALIAGRLRKEKNTYYLFNGLIGQGEVRKCFINQSNY
jgi:HTH-type transcriptional regulator/antitoxin HigA